jgi:ABC-type transporter Mla subunit MlaD
MMENVGNALAKLVQDDAASTGNSTIHEDFVTFKQTVNARMEGIEEDVKNLQKSVDSGFSSILEAMRRGQRGENDTSS